MSGDVSVILPARGDSPHLRHALASALACDEAAEVLLVTGRDGLAPALFADPRVRQVELSGPGVSAARNAGLAAARAPYLAFLDDDDVWLPDHLHRALELVRRHPDAVLLGCDAWVWVDPTPDGSAPPPADPTGLPRHAPGVPDGVLTLRRLLLGNPITTPSVVLVRERLGAADRFDPALDHMEDYDLWLRLARDRRLVYEARPGLIVRRRRGSASGEWRRMAEGSLTVLERFLAAGVPEGTLTRGELRRRIGALWHDLAYACLVEDDLPAARNALARAIHRRPLRTKNWSYLAVSLLPAAFRRRLLARGRRARFEHDQR
jgi:glycosyltransferase involved in cell wall biosynthesis